MGCIPIRKLILPSQSELNANHIHMYNNKQFQMQNDMLLFNNNNIHHNNSHQFKPKLYIERYFKILQKINTYIQHAYKVIHKTTQQEYTMIALLKSSLVNKNSFVSGYSKIIHIKHKNILTVYDVYEDSYCYYLICEYFDGNKLYDECNIEIEKYNEYTLSKIIKKIMKAIITFKEHGINDYYVDPQNIFCNFTSNKKIIIKVLYNQFFIGNNTTYDKIRNIFYLQCFTHKREECSLGILMYMMLFGNMRLLNETEIFEEKVYKQIKKSAISSQCKELLLNLLQIYNGNKMTCEKGLTSDFIIKANALNTCKLEEKLLKNISLFFNEICFYYKTISFCESYDHINNSLCLEIDIINSHSREYSLFNMKKEKIETEESDMNINVISFVNDIYLFRIKQQVHQLRRIFGKINNTKCNVIQILSLYKNEMFTKIISVLNAIQNDKVNFNECFTIIFDVVNEAIAKERNHLGKLIKGFQCVNMKNFNKEFIVIANKWYSSEDCFDMESFVKGHCSSSDIDSSDNDE